MPMIYLANIFCAAFTVGSSMLANSPLIIPAFPPAFTCLSKSSISRRALAVASSSGSCLILSARACLNAVNSLTLGRLLDGSS